MNLFKRVFADIAEPSGICFMQMNQLLFVIETWNTEYLASSFGLVKKVINVFQFVVLGFFFFVILYPIVLYFYLLSKVGVFIDELINSIFLSKRFPNEEDNLFCNNSNKWDAKNSCNNIKLIHN